MLNITDVKVKVVKDYKSAVAFCEVSFDDCLTVKNIVLCKNVGGYFLNLPSNPSKKNDIVKYYPIVLVDPILIKKMIDALVEEYQKNLEI
jgi:DNA-binding cell septation regulator SpoVG